MLHQRVLGILMLLCCSAPFKQWRRGPGGASHFALLMKNAGARTFAINPLLSPDVLATYALRDGHHYLTNIVVPLGLKTRHLHQVLTGSQLVSKGINALDLPMFLGNVILEDLHALNKQSRLVPAFHHFSQLTKLINMVIKRQYCHCCCLQISDMAAGRAAINY